MGERYAPRGAPSSGGGGRDPTGIAGRYDFASFTANDDPNDPTDDDINDRRTTATRSGNRLTVSESVDDDDDPATAPVVLTIVAEK